MAQRIVSSVAHVIVAPTSTNNYHAVTHADSGREVSRWATRAEAVVEQTRLNALEASAKR